ncbi:MAG: CopD family protein [Betaproteobacteria bacterium]|nr:CopD family protein [Betaproteobacteria bacterium]
MSPHLHALLAFLHLSGAIVWLGGMVFAHFALRPAASQVLEPPGRLALMSETLGRFFRLVAIAVIIILATGTVLLAEVGLTQAPLGWHLMLGLGIVMALIFGFIYAVLYPALRQAVAAQRWPAAAQVLGRIRFWVVVNMCLGVLTVAAAVLPR